jgi:Tat protein secretion system quality control protein TatD with DNase activity
MVDLHRHLLQPDELLPPSSWHIWFATSSLGQWSSIKQLPSHSRWKHGYGILPQALIDRVFSVEALASDLYDALIDDPLGFTGEIGLDSRYDVSLQFPLAETLMQVSDRVKRPVVIHHVGSVLQLEQLLIKASVSVPVIIHNFTGSIETARRISDLGAIVSLGPTIWKNQTRLAKRLAELDVPFVLETDYPYGDTDPETLYTDELREHYHHIAQLMHISQQLLEEHCDAHATLFTHWPAHR